MWMLRDPASNTGNQGLMLMQSLLIDVTFVPLILCPDRYWLEETPKPSAGGFSLVRL